MDLTAQTKYATMLGLQLDRFKVIQNSPYLANFRCPFCGDSQKSKSKARGYFYVKKNLLLFRCHNCGHGTTFTKFLKEHDANLYKDFVMEVFGKKSSNSIPEFIPKEEKKEETEASVLDNLMERVDKLPSDHFCRAYLESRKIPEKCFSHMYFVDDAKTLERFNPKYRDRLYSGEPRLVIPCFDRNRLLTAINSRSLDPKSKLRYFTMSLSDKPIVFGWERVSFTSIINVVEGPIDSFFLPNSIATTSAAKMHSLDKILPNRRFRLIYDNQPRNEEVCNLQLTAIRRGHNVVIWPENLAETDINDMILAEIDPLPIIEERTFNGLRALLEYNKWRKC